MPAIPDDLKKPLRELLLAVADDKLILGHRNSDWTGLAPILEEDIAFSSIAQDEIAHASAFYEFVAELEGGQPDAIAFGRKADEYRCAAIVTLPDEFDWASAIARQFLCDHFDLLRLRRLSASSHEELAALAGRLAAEERVHVEHADAWIQRLASGGDESRPRIQAALDKLAPVAATLFEPTEGQNRLETAGIYPLGEADTFDEWSAALNAVAHEAGLRLVVQPPEAGATGGRRGRHGAEFAKLLDEMCEVFRIEPTAAW